MQLLVMGLFSFVVTFIFIKLFLPLAWHVGFIDSPGGRKAHQNPTPVVGGIAMYLAILLSSLIFLPAIPLYRSFFLGGFLLIFVGLFDDRKALNAKYKLIAQIVTGLIIALWGNSISDLGNLWGVNQLLLTGLSVPFTILCVTASVNSINMVDGEDGFSASIILVEFIMLLMLAIWINHMTAVLLLLIILSSLLCFSFFNFPFKKNGHAKIFMGDAGSMYLGFVIAWFAIDLTQHAKVIDPVNIIWLIALPVFDMLRLFIHRIFSGMSPFSADRKHLHHLLVPKYKDKRLVCLLAMSLSLFFGLIGLTMQLFEIDARVSLMLFIMAFAIYSGFVSKQLKKIYPLNTEHQVEI